MAIILKFCRWWTAPDCLKGIHVHVNMQSMLVFKKNSCFGHFCHNLYLLEWTESLPHLSIPISRHLWRKWTSGYNSRSLSIKHIMFRKKAKLFQKCAACGRMWVSPGLFCLPQPKPQIRFRVACWKENQLTFGAQQHVRVVRRQA